jgi:hypothetical protein
VNLSFLKSPANLGLLLLLAGGVVYVVERLVVTDLEAIEGTIEAATEACQRGDFAALRELLTEDFRQEDGTDVEKSLVQAERAYRVYKPRGLECDVKETQIAGDEARVAVRVRALNPYGGFDVRLTLRREGKAWRISGAARTA